MGAYKIRSIEFECSCQCESWSQRLKIAQISFDWMKFLVLLNAAQTTTTTTTTTLHSFSLSISIRNFKEEKKQNQKLKQNQKKKTQWLKILKRNCSLKRLGPFVTDSVTLTEDCCGPIFLTSRLSNC